MSGSGLDVDAERLQRISRGDPLALGEFYDAHAARLLALACRILTDRQAAEDVVQEVFLQIWNRASGYNPMLGRPVTWAVAMTRNRAIDRLRAGQRTTRLADAILAHDEISADLAEASVGGEARLRDDEAAVVRRALEGLPAEQRRAIELAFYSGLTQTEIAESLGEPLGTVKARIRRGMLKLRDELAAVADFEPDRPTFRGSADDS